MFVIKVHATPGRRNPSFKVSKLQKLQAQASTFVDLAVSRISKLEVGAYLAVNASRCIRCGNFGRAFVSHGMAL